MRYDERMDGSLSGRRMRRDPDRDVRAARIKGVALLKTLSLNHEREKKNGYGATTGGYSVLYITPGCGQLNLESHFQRV